MRLTTEILQANLKGTAGKDTIKVYDNDEWLYIYHYGALICAINPNDEIVVYNQTYYAYSPTTAKVRNKAVELCGIAPLTTSELCKGKKLNGIHHIVDIVDFRDDTYVPTIELVATTR